MPSSHPSPISRRVGPGPIEVFVGDEPTISLKPLEHRVKVGLSVPGLSRVIDVSIQPNTACRALAEAASNARIDLAEVEANVRVALGDAAALGNAWVPPAEVELSGAFTGVAFPLLAAAYDAGASPIIEVPRWAEPILKCRTFGQGAVAGFGALATKPVRRALVEAIRPRSNGQIALGALVLALMGRNALQPDRLARVLRCECALHPFADLPDPHTLRTACPVFQGWGDRRSERVLVDAAARPDGLSLLLKTVGYALQLGDHGPPSPLPNRLADLHDAYRVLIPTNSRGGPTPAGITPRPRSRSGPQSNQVRGRPVPHPVLGPRTQLAAVAPATRLVAPAAFRALDGAVKGDLTFLLPRTVGDLGRWGRLLSNCLGDFGPSVNSGRTFIVGVERGRRLIYAIEITDRGIVRQFNGRGNRPPTDADRRAAISTLVQTGAMDPTIEANRPWLAGIGRRGLTGSGG